MLPYASVPIAAQKKWLKKILEPLEACDPKFEAILFKEGIEAGECMLDAWPDFDFFFEDEGLWLSSPESCNLEHVAQVVRAFLKKFNPDAMWSMTWAETSSRMRLNEFSGGGMLVTSKEILWCNPEQWLSKRYGEILDARKQAKRKKPTSR